MPKYLPEFESVKICLLNPKTRTYRLYRTRKAIMILRPKSNFFPATVQHTEPPMLPAAQRKRDPGDDHRRVRDLRPRPNGQTGQPLALPD